jgi:hypothetical protein
MELEDGAKIVSTSVVSRAIQISAGVHHEARLWIGAIGST